MPISYSAVVSALSTIIDSVAESGQVHTSIRWAKDWSALLAQFRTQYPSDSDPATYRLLGWMITRTNILPIPNDSPYSSLHRRHIFTIRGIFGFEDSESEPLFQPLVDSVVNALDTGDYSALTSYIPHSAGPATVRQLDLRMFGSTLAHYAEIEFGLDFLGDD